MQLQIVISAFAGFILANLLNMVETVMIYRVMKDVKEMLRQFKSEGRSDKWLT